MSDIQWLHRPDIHHHSSSIIGAKMSDGSFKRLDFDFVIWSPEMKSSAKYWIDYIPKEQELLTRTRPEYFTTAILNSRNVARAKSPVDYFFSNVIFKREHAVWAQRDSYALVQGYQGDDYQNGVYPSGDDGLDIRSTVVYAMGKVDPALTGTDLEVKFLDHAKSMGGTDLQVLNLTTWNYFPRFSLADMEEGVLWRILEMQGTYGMWYIGSSVCFESLKSVTDYNRMIVQNMEAVKK